MSHIQALIELLLLLVDYAETEINLVCFLKTWLHGHDLGEGFFGVLKGSVPIVEYADPVPQLWFLQRQLLMTAP